MKNFMDDDFLLTTETAKKLYHEHAEGMPIIDYHCHLQPKEIAEDAFRECQNLTSIAIPYGVQKIGHSAFYECGELTSVEIPDSVVEIGEWAFYKCEKLAKINLPNGLAKIDDFAFKGCSSLPEITIPDSVETIGSRVFEECAKLKKANLPKGIKEVPYGMFDGCKKLKDMSIPEGVTLIEGSAFDHCSSLTTLTIPTSVTSIGESAFAGARKLVLRIPKNSHEQYCRMRNIKYEYIETDSSLDCFVLVIRLGLKNGNVLKFIGEGGVKKGDREYHELFVSCSPAECGKCKNIDELVKTLRTSVVQGLNNYFDADEDPGEAAVFNEDSSFIKEIRQLKSMDEINTITINSDLWSAGKHNYKHYTYYMDSKETVYDHGGVKIEVDKVGGGSHIMQFPEFIKGDNQGQAIVEDQKGYDADVPMPAVITRGFW